MKKYLFIVLLLLIPHSAYATVCGTGSSIAFTDIGSGNCRAYVTSGSSWTVPMDWNSANNTIQVFGGGGAGGSTSGAGATYTGGGGGGGYSSATVTLTQRSTVNYSVGVGGSVTGCAGTAGGSTWLGGSTYASSLIGALGGGGGTCAYFYVQPGGVGGAASGGIGTTRTSGGTGGQGGYGGGGGGGAAGPNGNGGVGGNYVGGIAQGGGGGGGANGGSAGGDDYYQYPYHCTPGNGGNNRYSTGGGGACTSGSNGGGGGGGHAGSCQAGSGSMESYFGSYGPGGGGGGGTNGYCDYGVNPYGNWWSNPPINNGRPGSVYGGGGGGAAPYGSGGSGGQGLMVITYVPAAPTCTVTLTPSSVNQGSSSTLTYSSTGASTFYITNIGYVVSSGSATVAPTVTTNYAGTVTGPNGTGTCSGTLTVHPSCTLDGETVTHGSSATAYLASTVPYGSTCSSQSRTCTDGTLSGSYAYGSCSVSAAASCTLDGETIAHGDSITSYSSEAAPSGQLCSSVSQSRTCTDGTLSGSSSYQYASCSCTPVYSCSDQTVQYTNAACAVSTITTCSSPAFCSAGSAACLYAPVEYIASGDLSGHLVASPSVLPQGTPTTLYWNLDNVSSCTVSGNGATYTGASSGLDGQLTGNINQQTTFSLSCTGLDGSAVSESVVVNILPVFQEN